MFILKFINRPITLKLTLALAVSSLVLLIACNDAETENKSVVKVTATHDAEENKHLFEMSTDEISSGWTTFQFDNASGYDHFFLIWQVPEQGIVAAEAAGEPLLNYWFQGVTEPFQKEFNSYLERDLEFDVFTNNLVGTISEKAPWFFDPGAKTMGAPGFTAAGRTSKTTITLEPGEYIVECYVKNKEEVFHSYIGMLEHISVTDEVSDAEEPKPTNSLTISSTEGIKLTQPLTAGSHIIEISFKDQKSYAHLLGHNVQLLKLTDREDDKLLSNLSAWMDWRKPGSLVNRAPEGAEFLGGTMEMTQGGTAYFHVNLEPGDYAWIAEIPNPDEHNMLKTFTIK
jgi:plastocyanin